jgi:NADH-quinone oxidoreductase subunit J
VRQPVRRLAPSTTMDTNTALFYVFSAVLLVAAFRVITARSPVYAALFLVLAFFSAACVWILLRAEFLAIALVLVYVGAVMVLFLFVVMMLDVDIGSLRSGFWKHFPVAALVGVIISLEMAAVLLPGFRLVDAPTAGAAALKLGNTKLLGIEVYTKYLYPLQIAAVLLLVAIIAAISLTLRARKDSKRTDPSEQIKAKKADRVRIVSMKPEGVPRDTASDAAKPVGDRR